MPQVVAAAAALLSAIGTTAASFVGVTLAAGSTAAIIVGGALVVGSMLALRSLYEVDMPKMDSDSSRQSTVRSTVEPRKLIYGEALVSGPLTYVGVAGANNADLYQVIALAGHEVNAITDIWFDDVVIQNSYINGGNTAGGGVTTGTFGSATPFVYINKHNGTASQTADTMMSAAFNNYTAQHRGDGIAYIAMKWTLNEDTSQTWDDWAPRNIKALIQGKKIYDPRDDTSPGANPTNSAYISYSDNPALCCADYLMDSSFGLGIAASKIDWDAVVTAANYCDATVSVPNSGTEKRFTCNGVIFGGDNHKTNIGKILSSMMGTLTYVNGKYIIRSNDRPNFSVEFTDDDLAGAVSINTSAERGDRFNTVKGVFIDPSSNHKNTDFPQVQISALVNRDNGEELEKQLQLPMTNTSYMAQRIAHRTLLQTNLQRVMTVPVNLRGMNVKVGDTVRMNLSDLDIVDEDYRCLSWSFSETGGVNLILQQLDSDPINGVGDEFADPLAGEYSTVTYDGTITDAQSSIYAPTGLAAVPTSAGIQLSWTPPSFTKNLKQYEIYASDDNQWANRATIGTTLSSNFLYNLTPGSTKYFWIRAIGEGTTLFSDRSPDSDTSTVSATAIAPTRIFQQTTAPSGGTYTNQDIWIDTDGEYKTYVWDGSDWVEASSAAAALTAAEGAQSTADGKIETFYQDAEPAAIDSSEGDLWIDTNDGNKLYRYNSQGGDPETFAWELARDGGIAQAISDASDADAKADGKITTFFAASGSPPTADAIGDLWWTTDTKKFYRAEAAGADQIAAGEWVITNIVAETIDSQGNLATQDSVDYTSAEVTNTPTSLTDINANEYGILDSIQGIPITIPGGNTQTVTKVGLDIQSSGNQTVGNWSTQFYSVTGSNACGVIWTVGSTTSRYMIGLNDDPATSANFGGINYCWYVRGSSGDYQIYESGTPVTSIGTNGSYSTITSGDMLIVSWDGTTIRYFHNGTLVREVVPASPASAYYLDSSIDGIGNQHTTVIKNISFIVSGSTKPQLNRDIYAEDGTTLLADADLRNSALDVTNNGSNIRITYGSNNSTGITLDACSNIANALYYGAGATEYTGELDATHNSILASATSDPTGQAGEFYYNSATKEWKYYNGTAWVAVSTIGATVNSNLYQADGTTQITNDNQILNSSVEIEESGGTFRINYGGGTSTGFDASGYTNTNVQLSNSGSTLSLTGGNAATVTLDASIVDNALAYSGGGTYLGDLYATLNQQGNALNLDSNMTGVGNSAGWKSTFNQAVLDTNQWTFTTTSTSPSSGNTILSITDDDDSSEQLHSNRVPINPSLNYRVSFWGRQTAGNRRNYLGVAFVDASGNNIAANSGSDAVGWSAGTYHYFGVINQTFPSDWTYYEKYFGPGYAATIPTGAVSAQIMGLFCRNAATTGTETTVEIAEYKLEMIYGADWNSGDITGQPNDIQIKTEKIIEFFEYPTSAGLASLPWYNKSGGGELTIVSGVGEAGGNVMSIGNNAGNDQLWLIADDVQIPYDPDRVYRIRVRARQTAGSGDAYFGFAGVAADGTTYVNRTGANDYSSQHYVAANGVDIPSTWTVYEGYVSGHAANGVAGNASTFDSPYAAQNNVRYLRPLILVNYENLAGTTQIDSFIIEDIGANPAATVGAQINSNLYLADGTTLITADNAILNSELGLSISGTGLSLDLSGTGITLDNTSVGLGAVPNVDATDLSNVTAGTLGAAFGGTGITDFSTSAYANANIDYANDGSGVLPASKTEATVGAQVGTNFYDSTGTAIAADNAILNSEIGLTISGTGLSLDLSGTGVTLDNTSVGLDLVPNVDATDLGNVTAGTLAATYGGTGITDFSTGAYANVNLNYSSDGTGTLPIDNIDRTVANNLIAIEEWTLGRTSFTGKFGIYGSASVADNEIVLTDGPFGNTVLAWKGTTTVDQTGTGSWCGGFTHGFSTAAKTIDPDKTYRYTCWVRRNSTNGNFYIGWGSNKVAALGTTTLQSNPYSFPNKDVPSANKWYLAVAIIHPTSYTGGHSGLSGWWDPETGKLNGTVATEYNHAPSITSNFLRTAQYRTTTNITTEFYAPRWDEVNGTEPSIVDLLGAATVGATWGTDLNNQPANLSAINSTEGTKLGGIQAGATVGATWGSDITSQPADSDLLNSYNKGKSLALVIDGSPADGSANGGEHGLVGCNNTGAPVLNTDGFIVWDGATITIPRNQANGYTVLTNLANKKGFIVFDTAKDGDFTVDTVSGVDVVFAYKDGSQWKYDNNTSNPQNFTPQSSYVAIGYIETGASETTLAAGLFGEPISLTLAPFAAATLGATWGTDIGSQPTNLAGINSTEGTKLGGIQAGATVGADWNSNITGQPYDSAIKSERIVDTFEYSGTSLSGTPWVNYSGSGEVSFLQDGTSVAGGKVMQIGNNSGNDMKWMISSAQIPYDPNRLYRISVRAKKTAGSGTAYFGFAGVAGDGTTLVNAGGSNSHTGQHYAVASGITLPSTFTEYEAFVSGHSSTGLNGDGTFDSPKTAQTNVRYLRPLILVNYNQAAGISVIDSFIIEDIGANPNVSSKSIALNINAQSANGFTYNSGEFALVGTNAKGEGVAGTDGYILWDSAKIIVEHDQYTEPSPYVAYTGLTSQASTKGWIAFDTSKSNPFTVASVAMDVAFVRKVGSQWSYDNNSTWVNFTPNGFMVALGWLQTGVADNIAAGGLIEPVTLTLAPGGSATEGATWGTDISSQPTNLSGINSVEGTKLSGIASGATVGATWGTNITGRPSTPSFVRSLAFGTMSSGGFGDVRFGKNQNATSANDGEIRISGSVFYHPDGTSRSILGAREVATPYEGATTQDPFFVIYTDTDPDTRFGTSGFTGISSYSPNFFAAIYNEIADTWQAVDNNNTKTTFSPLDSDVIVAVGRKYSGSGGIDELATLIGSNADLATEMLNTGVTTVSVSSGSTTHSWSISNSTDYNPSVSSQATTFQWRNGEGTLLKTKTITTTLDTTNKDGDVAYSGDTGVTMNPTTAPTATNSATITAEYNGVTASVTVFVLNMSGWTFK